MAKREFHGLLLLRQLPTLFWFSFGLVGLMVLVGSLWPQGFLVATSRLNDWIFLRFGGFYLWLVAAMLVGFVTLAVSPLGRIRLGGPDAKPEFSFTSWFSMLFGAGMGTGLLFWGPAEPLFHALHPPLLQATTADAAALNAFQLTFFHWGLHPWAIYGMTALAVALLGHSNGGKFFRFGDLLRLPGDGWLVRRLPALTDGVTVLAILFGVAATFGMGVVQMVAGCRQLLGWELNAPQQGLLIAVMTGLYLLSSLKGLKSGIQFFSNLSLWGSVVLLALVTCFGPKAGLGLPVLASLPSFLANLGPWSLGLADYRDPFWVRDWTMKYWSWWLAWAPFVGMFIALISKGRTVREFVGGVLLAPTLFSVLWFFVFGEAAIALARQAHGHPLLTGLGDTGNVLYWVVGSLPGGQWLNLLCLLLISLFFINSADSATYTLAALARGRLQEPPPALAQIAWGVLLAVLASLFLFSGGIGLLQQVTLVSVLPFSILLVMILGRLGLVLFRISLLKPEESKQLPESRFRPRLAAVRPRLSVE